MITIYWGNLKIEPNWNLVESIESGILYPGYYSRLDHWRYLKGE